MSASLVGSEMCIRDRPLLPQTAKISVYVPFKRAPWQVHGSKERLPVRAVSYTHLTLPTICSV
eukprot:1647390-Alexandrium_andersonii.AAC.1